MCIGDGCRLSDIPATICSAPNHNVALDLTAARPPSLMLEPPACHLNAWHEGEGFGTVVTHTVPIGNFGGPYRFFDHNGHLL